MTRPIPPLLHETGEQTHFTCPLTSSPSWCESAPLSLCFLLHWMDWSIKKTKNQSKQSWASDLPAVQEHQVETRSKLRWATCLVQFSHFSLRFVRLTSDIFPVVYLQMRVTQMISVSFPAQIVVTRPLVKLWHDEPAAESGFVNPTLFRLPPNPITSGIFITNTAAA